MNKPSAEQILEFRAATARAELELSLRHGVLAPPWGRLILRVKNSSEQWRRVRLSREHLEQEQKKCRKAKKNS